LPHGEKARQKHGTHHFCAKKNTVLQRIPHSLSQNNHRWMVDAVAALGTDEDEAHGAGTPEPSAARAGDTASRGGTEARQMRGGIQLYGEVRVGGGKHGEVGRRRPEEIGSREAAAVWAGGDGRGQRACQATAPTTTRHRAPSR
jgi:hypothetical protein